MIAKIRAEGEPVDGPPWPLSRSEIDAFAVGGLHAVDVEQVSGVEQPGGYRWRATFRRDGTH
ncbi:hypothetical protein [Nocardia sp. NPDC050710]|uniref:hypothetical protein n=1 Tax=Nocardia sp. NPDC050710 TaxID=3157220 RepID=UPI0033DEF51C